eukprot:scaffold212048_cov21-Prasinocladus_malaysianus.AAC.1
MRHAAPILVDNNSFFAYAEAPCRRRGGAERNVYASAGPAGGSKVRAGPAAGHRRRGRRERDGGRDQSRRGRCGDAEAAPGGLAGRRPAAPGPQAHRQADQPQEQGNPFGRGSPSCHCSLSPVGISDVWLSTLCKAYIVAL